MGRGGWWVGGRFCALGGRAACVGLAGWVWRVDGGGAGGGYSDVGVGEEGAEEGEGGVGGSGCDLRRFPG